MHGKPLSSIAAELNNVLTVFAMCADEVEQHASSDETLADMRDALSRGVALTRALSDAAAREASAPEINPLTMKVPSHPIVLLVEEDTTLRAAVTRVVTARGVHVLDACSTTDALQKLETVTAIDLVVVETTLEGRRFAGRIVERYPQAAVLYIGGYVDDEPLRAELPRTPISLVCRPVTTSILVDRIDQALAKTR